MQFKTTKLMAGMYRVSNGRAFSNIWKGKDYNGEMTTKWYCDIRDCDTGTMHRYGGIWNSLGEAMAEAKWILRDW